MGAAFFVAAVATALGEGSSLDSGNASTGDGEAVGAWAWAVGAGMTVTTGVGDGVWRRRVGDGDGFAGDELALSARDGDGLAIGGGGMTELGVLDACAFGALLGCALEVGVGLGRGDGEAACAGTSSSAGVSTVPTTRSSSGRRAADTRRL